VTLIKQKINAPCNGDIIITNKGDWKEIVIKIDRQLLKMIFHIISKLYHPFVCYIINTVIPITYGV
jgi:hypothetical protein